MNKRLILHIVKTEYKSSKKNITVFFAINVIFLIVAILVPFKSQDSKNAVVLFFTVLFLLSLISILNSSILPNAHVRTTKNQSNGFNWKYLHSIINDRTSFIFGECLSALCVTWNIHLSAIITIHYFNLPFDYYFLGLVLLIPVIILLRLNLIYSNIEQPRKSYFIYKNNLSKGDKLKIWFEKLLTSLILPMGYLSLTFPFFILSNQYNQFYTIGFLFVLAIIFILILLKKINKEWSNEKLSFFELKRDYKKLLLLTISSLLILAFCFQELINNRQNDIFYFISENKIKKVKILIKNKQYINQIAYEQNYYIDSSQIGMTPLMYSISINATDIAKMLINEGANLNNTKENIGPLSIAAQKCNLELIDLLISKGTNVNQIFENNQTGLFYAVTGKCITGIHYLIKNGANPNHKNDKGLTYIDFAKINRPMFYTEILYDQKLK